MSTPKPILPFPRILVEGDDMHRKNCPICGDILGIGFPGVLSWKESPDSPTFYWVHYHCHPYIQSITQEEKDDAV